MREYPAHPSKLSDFGIYLPASPDLDLNSKNDPMQAPAIEEFYSRSSTLVSGMEVSLYGDPVKRGLGVFLEKTARLRQYMNTIVRLIFSGIKIRNITQSNYLLAKEIFEQEVRTLMTPMPDWQEDGAGKKSRVSLEIKRMRSEMQLEESRRKLQTLENKYLEAKSFVDGLLVMRDNCKQTRDDLLFSLTTIRTQLLIGELPMATGGLKLSKRLEEDLVSDKVEHAPRVHDDGYLAL